METKTIKFKLQSLLVCFLTVQDLAKLPVISTLQSHTTIRFGQLKNQHWNSSYNIHTRNELCDLRKRWTKMQNATTQFWYIHVICNIILFTASVYWKSLWEIHNKSVELCDYRDLVQLVSNSWIRGFQCWNIFIHLVSRFFTYKSHGLKRKVSESCASVKFKKIANMNNFRILNQLRVNFCTITSD